MDQSTLVVGALLAGFVLYLAAAQRLGIYVAILTGRTQQQAASSGSSAAGGGLGGIIGGIIGQGGIPNPAAGGGTSTPAGGATGSF